MKNTPRAKAGDIAKCARGHHLYRVLTDIMPGTTIASRIFEPIAGAPKPEYGKPLQRCHICDAPWVTKGLNGGWVMCDVEEEAKK